MCIRKYLLWIPKHLTATPIITVTRCTKSKRISPRVQLSAKTFDKEVGYIQPSSLGSAEKLNISNILNILLDTAKKAQERMAYAELIANGDPETSSTTEKGIKKIKRAEHVTRAETTTKRRHKHKTEKKKIKVEKEVPKISDESDEKDEQPVMRNREALEEEDLQYDIDDEDLAISLKK